MFGEFLKKVREIRPLIHCITNYVSANDCANILLACGASPIMADEAEEMDDITRISNGLTINIGTLNSRVIPAMLSAGRSAGQLKHPVVLDPVGAGASRLRTATALKLLEEMDVTVIRGNISEIKALADQRSQTKGVDADDTDMVTEADLNSAVDLAKSFAEKTGAIIAITGAIDIVADHASAYCITNGHPMMSAVTGTGCQLSALITAFVAANPDQPLAATAAAVCAFGYAGEIAAARCTAQDGNATYGKYLIDAVYNMCPTQLAKGAKYEVY